MPERTCITNHSRVSDGAFARAVEAVRHHASLSDILDWCQVQAGQRDLADVVVQDEYTHDIVIELEAGLVAVYDAT